MMTKKINEKSVAGAKKMMESCLDEFEKVWLAGGKKKYVVGDKISVADILAVCEMEQPTMAGYDPTEGREVLGEYVRRIKAELNPHYDEVSSLVYKMRDRYGGSVPGVYPPPTEPSKL